MAPSSSQVAIRVRHSWTLSNVTTSKQISGHLIHRRKFKDWYYYRQCNTSLVQKKPALVVYFEYMCMCVNCAVSQPIFTSKVENRKTVLAPSAEPLHTLNLLTTIPTWQKLICCSHCIHPNFLSFIESLFLSNSAIDIIVKFTDYYTHF